MGAIPKVNEQVVYPELSYQVVGSAFSVYNEYGPGFSEKHYQRAFAKELEKFQIPYEREKRIDLSYKEFPVGKYFLDFVIDGKIVVELKVRPRFGYVHIKQVMGYLQSGGYKLAIIIYFTKEGVQYRRIVNNI